jgi:hypothetical protein
VLRVKIVSDCSGLAGTADGGFLFLFVSGIGWNSWAEAQVGDCPQSPEGGFCCCVEEPPTPQGGFLLYGGMGKGADGCGSFFMGFRVGRRGCQIIANIHLYVENITF